jgi:4-amino-4-deoxy-L-arabinose transferase-like glycosyltransferase
VHASERGDAESLRKARLGLLVLLALAALVVFPFLDRPGWFDNEGRYAEVAREMLETGDWITPHMNGEVFLNKPPLTFWLTACLFWVAGLTEAARLVSGVAVLATAALLFGIGRRLRDPETGLWSAAVFLTALMTPVEAGFLRPDSLLTAWLSLSIWGFLRAREARPAVGLAALWAGMGFGVLTKGLLGVFLPAIVLGPALLLGGELRDWRRYCPGWGIALGGAIALPWHVAAGVLNDGFWWDYVVNQHLLFFLHRKFPRDSTPIPLWAAWVSVAGRLFPWVLCLPAAAVTAAQGARGGGAPAWLPLCWFGAVFGFFSASQGRLEQHFVPAIPGAALLLGAWCARFAAAEPRSRGGLVPLGLMAAAGLGAFFALPAALNRLGAAAEAPELPAAAGAAMLLLGLGGVAALGLTALGRRRPALAVLVLALLAMGSASRAGVRAVEPLLSARAVIARTPPALLAESEVAYEAGEEYQLCGVLNFYLRRRILLLEPPGFIPPTYLRQDVGRLFTSRERFFADWAAGRRRYLLFTDPERSLDRPADFPQPHFEVARGGGRALLTNLPLAAPRE